MVLEIVDEWGQRVLGASLVYTLVSMVVVYALLAQGAEPPPLVPREVAGLYASAYRQWLELSGRTLNASATDILYLAANSITLVMKNVVGFLFNLSFGILWLGVLAASYLPAPLAPLRIVLWAAAAFMNIILLLYLLKIVQNAIKQLLPFPWTR